MGALTPRPSKSKSWLVLFGIVSVILLIFMLSLAYVLIAQPNVTAEAAPTATRPEALSLPTASAPTLTPGPPLAERIDFTVEEPVEGFSNCDRYGFEGVVIGRNGEPLQGVQIVVWDNQTGLVSLTTTDRQGTYLIELEQLPPHRKLWIQIFANDLPVAQPLLVEPNVDCQTGFQVYRINWRQTAE
ncbi:MAG: carboxypeptidase regulatory-like domain-containing protein [Anaerolineaceae bacterium]|nr:carboxypeptidase regulatory-like domain-containing protein [Anaerolineaceae bacterium]MCB9101290.1 carboxypeptidase regulatory-like domain-containing protein [Anaerolineales bacterium]